MAEFWKLNTISHFYALLSEVKAVMDAFRGG